ncbi:hypothetical protein Dimus_037491 [Dionaea muscipula]
MVNRGIKMVLIKVENGKKKCRIIDDDDEKMPNDQAYVSGARRSGEEENQQVSSVSKEVSKGFETASEGDGDGRDGEIEEQQLGGSSLLRLREMRFMRMP